MKLLIQKTNETKGNIKKIELTSSDFENNTNTYVIKKNESPIIYLTDTESSYFIDDIDSKLERVNSETVAIITMDDLISLGSGTGGDSRPYKVYTALLNQSGTDAPVATVLENTLGGDVIWSYSSIGIYNAVTNGFFTLNKTIGFFSYSLSQGDEIFMTVKSTDINTIELINRTSTTSVQDMFSGQIEIRVYN